MTCFIADFGFIRELQMLQQANLGLEKGNDYFLQREFREAIRCYKKVIQFAEEIKEQLIRYNPSNYITASYLEAVVAINDLLVKAHRKCGWARLYQATTNVDSSEKTELLKSAKLDFETSLKVNEKGFYTGFEKAYCYCGLAYIALCNADFDRASENFDKTIKMSSSVEPFKSFKGLLDLEPVIEKVIDNLLPAEILNRLVQCRRDDTLANLNSREKNSTPSSSLKEKSVCLEKTKGNCNVAKTKDSNFSMEQESQKIKQSDPPIEDKSKTINRIEIPCKNTTTTPDYAHAPVYKKIISTPASLGGSPHTIRLHTNPFKDPNKQPSTQAPQGANNGQHFLGKKIS